MAYPVTLSGLSTAVACVGPYANNIEVQFAPTVNQGFSFGLSASQSRLAAIFTTASANSIANVTLCLSKHGAPTDNLQVEIYAVSAGIPTGNSLGTSNVVVGSGLLVDWVLPIKFTFSTPVNVSSGGTYAAVVARTGSYDNSNYYQLGWANSGGANLGAYENAGTWYQHAGHYPFFFIGTSTWNYYLFGRNGTSGAIFEAYKASDPQSSWSEIATITPQTGSAFSQASSAIVGNISNLLSHHGGSLNYFQFNMASDAFGTAESIASGFTSNGQTGSSQYGCSIVVRSNGNAVAFFNGTQTKKSGTNYARVYWSERTTSWSAPALVCAEDGADHFYPEAVIGASDRVHFIWGASTPRLYHRSLSGANALDTASYFTSGQALTGVGYRGVSYDRSGTIKVALLGWNGGGATAITPVYFDSGANPTLNTGSGIATSKGVQNLFNDGTDVWALWVDSSNNDLLVAKSTNDGSSFSDTATAMSASVVISIDANLSRDGLIWQRGSYVETPFVANDGGTLKVSAYTVRTLAYDLAATSLTVGSPVIGAPTFDTPNKTVTATSLAVGAPEIGVAANLFASDQISGPTNATISADITSDPYGGNTADKLIEGSGGVAQHFVEPTATVATGVQVSFWADIRAGERNWAYLALDQATAGIYVNFATGEWGTQNGTISSKAIINLGSGWWRVRLTRDAAAHSSFSCDIVLATADGTIAYDGDGSSGIYVGKVGVTYGTNHFLAPRLGQKHTLTSSLLAVSSPVIGPVYSLSTSGNYGVGQFFGMPGTREKYGQTFTITADVAIGDVIFGLSKSNSPTDQLYVDVYETDANKLPTGSSLGTSDSIDGASLSAVIARITFKFQTPISLQNGVRYAAVISRSGALDGTNRYALYGPNISSYANNGQVWYQSSAWSYSDTDVALRVDGVQPSLSIVSALSATNLSVQPPTLGTPTLAVTVPLSATSLTTATPNVGVNTQLSPTQITSWDAPTRASVSPNVADGPNGPNTADKLVENTDNNSHFVSYTSNNPAGTCTLWAELKAAGRDWGYLWTSASTWAYFNLSNGTIGQYGGSPAIVPIGNGYYRCSITGTFAANAWLTLFPAISDNGFNYQGDGSSGILVGNIGFCIGTDVGLGPPALTQKYALSATSLTVGLPTFDAPSLSATVPLSATSLAVQVPTFGTPALAITVPLSATSLAVASALTLGTPTLTQKHALSAADYTDGVPTFGTPTISQKHVLLATSYADSAPTLGAPSATVTVPMSATSLTVNAPTFGTPSISQKHALAATSYEDTVPSIGTPSISQKHVLIATSYAGGALTFGTPPLGIAVPLSATNLSVNAPTFGIPSIWQKHVLSATAFTDSVPSFGTPSIGQKHALSAVSFEDSPPVLPTPQLSVSSVSFIAVPLTVGAPTIGAPAEGIIHNLSATSYAGSAPSLGTPSIGQKHVLSATSFSDSVPTIGAPSLALAINLLPTSLSVGAPVLGSPSIAQKQVLSATSITTAAPALGSPQLALTANLTAQPFADSPPSFGTPSIGQKHTMSAASFIDSAPVIAAATLSQKHTLSATSLAVPAPTIGAATAGIIRNLSATNLSAGAPVFSSPTLTQTYGQILAVSLEVGSPVLDAPDIHQKQVLAAASLVGGAPSIGQATITQKQALTASGVSVSPPTLQAPALHQSHSLTAVGIDVAVPIIGQPGATAILNGLISATDQPDSAQGSGTVDWQLQMAASETPDQSAITGSVTGIVAYLDVVESADQAAMAAVFSTTGVFQASERPDTLAFRAPIPKVEVVELFGRRGGPARISGREDLETIEGHA